MLRPPRFFCILQTQTGQGHRFFDCAGCQPRAVKQAAAMGVSNRLRDIDAQRAGDAQQLKFTLRAGFSIF